MKVSEALELVSRFEASYGRELSDEARKVWCHVFADVDPASAFSAFDSLAATEQFPPTPQRIRAHIAITALPTFVEVFAELEAAAATCDYFDTEPPQSLSPVAWRLARALGWSDFRVQDLADTYYQHVAERRFADITQRAQQRITAGLPAFEATFELGDNAALNELVEGIGAEA